MDLLQVKLEVENRLLDSANETEEHLMGCEADPQEHEFERIRLMALDELMTIRLPDYQ